MFLNGCKQLGLQEQQLFQVDDLVAGKKLRNVAVTIHWLAYLANQLNLSLPPFDPLHISRISLPNDQKMTFDLSSAKTQTALKPKHTDAPAAGTPISNEIATSMDELDKMLLELEVDPAPTTRAAPAPSPTPPSAAPTTRAAPAPAPAPVIAPFGASNSQSSLAPRSNPAGSGAPPAGQPTTININIHSSPAPANTSSPVPVLNSAPPTSLPRVVSSSGPSSSISQPSPMGGNGTFSNPGSQTHLPIPNNAHLSNAAPAGMQAASPRGSNPSAPSQNKPAPVWKDSAAGNPGDNLGGYSGGSSHPPAGGFGGNPSGSPAWNDRSGDFGGPGGNPAGSGGYSGAPSGRNSGGRPNSGGSPAWSERTDPNQSHCHECSAVIFLGKSAYSWANNTYCL